MYKATKYLLEQGHRNIGYVGTASRSELDHQRYEGYSLALQEYGLQASEELLYLSYPDFEGGLKIAERILEDNRCTAIVCSADIIALGIMNKLEQLGKKIPDDLSIIGFDDIREASYAYPSLTTVRQNIVLKGELVMEALKQEIENENIERRITGNRNQESVLGVRFADGFSDSSGAGGRESALCDPSFVSLREPPSPKGKANGDGLPRPLRAVSQ